MAIIAASTRGYMDKVPVAKVKDFEKEYLDLMKSQHKNVMDNFRAGKLDDADMETVKKVSSEMASKY